MTELSQSLSQITFGEVMGGMALFSAAFVPGMRGIARKGDYASAFDRWISNISPEGVRATVHQASRLADRFDRNIRLPIQYGLREFRDRSNTSPADWMFAPMETFREFSTQFKSSFRDGWAYAAHMQLPEDPVMQVMTGFSRGFEKLLKAQMKAGDHLSVDELLGANPSLVTDIKTVLTRSVYEGPKNRHMTVASAIRHQSVAEGTEDASRLLREARAGGPSQAYEAAKGPFAKLRLAVDKILDRGGLDRGDFRQATLRDHRDMIERQIASMEGQTGDWYDRRRARLRTMKDDMDRVLTQVGGMINVDVDDMLGLEVGRGVYMLGGEMADVSRLKPGRVLGNLIEAFYEHVHIPFMNANPLDIFQYPLLREIKRNYGQFTFKHVGDADDNVKNLIHEFRFRENIFGDMEPGTGSFSFSGHHYRVTPKNIEVLSKEATGYRFRPVGGPTRPVWGLEVPLFTSVQRLLLGKGLNDGVELNQGYLTGSAARTEIENRMMDETGRVDDAAVGRILMGRRVRGLLGVGNEASISANDFSAVGLFQAILGRRDEPWHRAVPGDRYSWLRRIIGPRRGSLSSDGAARVQEQVRDITRVLQGDESIRRRYPTGRFLGSGVMGDEDTLEALRGLAKGVEDEQVSAGILKMVDELGRFMGRPTGDTRRRLLGSFLTGRHVDPMAHSIKRAIQESSSTDDILMSRLSRIVPGTSVASDETVLEYIQRQKFQSIIASALDSRKKGRGYQPGMVQAIGGLRDHLLAGGSRMDIIRARRAGGKNPSTAFTQRLGLGQRNRRDAQDLINLSVVAGTDSHVAASLLNSDSDSLTDTMRRLFSVHRPPHSSEMAGGMVNAASRVFTSGGRSMQSTFITGHDLARMVPHFLFERPLRIRGKMLGERLPVGGIVNPFRKGFIKGMKSEHTDSAGAFAQYVKSSFVGSVLLNNLIDITAIGILVHGLKPGGLVDTVTGGVLYDNVSKAIATTTAGFAFARNTIPFVPYMNIGGESGTIDIVPGPLNVGLSTLGDSFRWAESLFPKMVSSPLTQFLVGGSLMWGGLRTGALMGRPGLGLLAGAAANLFTGMNPLDEPTATARETYDILSGKKEVAHRASRWWLIGSTPFEGNQPLFYRPHMVAQIGQGERMWNKFGGGTKGKLRHLLYTTPGLGQAMQVANPRWVVNGRPDEMAYMESGVPLTYFPMIGPTLAIALQVFSGGRINKHLSAEGTKRFNDLKARKVKPQNEQEFSVYMGVDPYSSGDLRYLAGLQIKQLQNWLGIFGFSSEVAIAKIGESLGIEALKTGHPFLHRPVIESSLEAQNLTRSYEELNLGDPGFSSAVEFGGMRLQRFPTDFVPSTEFLRRFLIRKSPQNYGINFAPNPLWSEGRYPANYFHDFTQGSDYSRYRHYSDIRGMTAHAVSKYSIYEIAAKMAPFSDWSRSVIAQTPDPEMAEELRGQVYRDIRRRIRTEPYRFIRDNTWSPYTWKGASAKQIADLKKGIRSKTNPGHMAQEADELDEIFDETRRENFGLLGGVVPEFGLGMAWEAMTHGKYHRGFWIRKGWSQRTALEEYREKRIFGHDFAQWERPYSTFVKPVFTETLAEGPFLGGAKMAAMSSLFFRTKMGRLVGGVSGAAVGVGGGAWISSREYATGQPFIPQYTQDLLKTQSDLDTMAYIRGEQSMLGYPEEQPMNYLGFPPLERRLLRDMRRLRGGEKEALLALLPDRLGQIVSPSRYHGDAVKEEALKEYHASELAQSELGQQSDVPFPAVQAAVIQKTGFSPYNFGVYPQMAQVGQILLEEEDSETNYPAVDYRMRKEFGGNPYTYMNAFKAVQVIRQHDEWVAAR